MVGAAPPLQDGQLARRIKISAVFYVFARRDSRSHEAAPVIRGR